jgi:tRNA(Ile2) C34 agmatinyltransferase TiaS|tara:strand:- start:1351 stop:1578 length:228 start_codon:yes stop_codon:yes gene_type:complete
LSDKILIKAFNNIDTVQGVCENCGEETILVGIVTDYYRCTNCGADTRQHINGSIRYLQLSEKDKNWLREKYGEKI